MGLSGKAIPRSGIVQFLVPDFPVKFSLMKNVNASYLDTDSVVVLVKMNVPARQPVGISCIECRNWPICLH